MKEVDSTRRSKGRMSGRGVGRTEKIRRRERKVIGALVSSGRR